MAVQKISILRINLQSRDSDNVSPTPSSKPYSDGWGDGERTSGAERVFVLKEQNPEPEPEPELERSRLLRKQTDL